MTIDDFARMTVGVAGEDDVAAYVPTLLFPDNWEILGIEGIPAEIDHRDAVQTVILRNDYQKRTFFFGVRSGSREITVGHFRPGEPTEFIVLIKGDDGFDEHISQSCS
jgi:hypothetical protein